jgi:DNA (cytosine-5)-methyltransferase 1
VSEAVTAKWAKQSAGPAGDETQNLVALALMDRTRMGAKHLELQADAAYALSGENRWGGERQMVAATLNAGGHVGGFRTESGEHLVVEDGGDALGADGADQVEADGPGGGDGGRAAAARAPVPAVGPGAPRHAGLRPGAGEADGDGQFLLLAPLPEPLPPAEGARGLLGGEDARERAARPAGGAGAPVAGVPRADVVGARADGEVPPEAVAFNWQSGGSKDFVSPRAGHTDALHVGQTPAVAYQCHGSNVGPLGTLREGDGGLTSGVPFVAAPLTTTYGKTVDHAGKKGSGPENLVVTPVVLRDERGRGSGDRAIEGQTYPLHAAKGPSEQQIVAQALSAEGADASEDGTGRGTPLVIEGVDLYNAKFDGQRSGTLDSRASKGGGPSVAVGPLLSVRRLTPVECERLQNFPDMHTCLCGVGDEYRATLRVVWEAARAEGLSGPAARVALDAVQETVLRLVLRKATPREDDGLPADFWPQARAEALSGLRPILRALLRDDAAPPGPQGREPVEQRADEHPLVVRVLPREAPLGGRQLRRAHADAAAPPDGAGSDGRHGVQGGREGGGDHAAARGGDLDALPDSAADRYWETCCVVDEVALRCRCPDSARYRAMGNAVTVSVVEWLAGRLRAALAR